MTFHNSIWENVKLDSGLLSVFSVSHCSNFFFSVLHFLGLTLLLNMPKKKTPMILKPCHKHMFNNLPSKDNFVNLHTCLFSSGISLLLCHFKKTRRAPKERFEKWREEHFPPLFSLMKCFLFLFNYSGRFHWRTPSGTR